MAVTIVKNSDYVLQFTLTDSASEAIDIASLEDVWVCVYQKKGVNKQSWKLSEDSVTIVDADAGVVSVALDRKNTEDTVQGRLFAEISVVQANAAFESGERVSTMTDIVVGDIKDSANT